MKQFIFTVLIAFAVTFVACAEPINENRQESVSIPNDTPLANMPSEAITESPADNISMMEQGNITEEIIDSSHFSYPEDVAPNVYKSIEALQEAISNNAETNPGNYEINAVNQIQTFFVPVFENPDYLFRHVEISHAAMEFYYVPEEDLELPGVWSRDYICVTIMRNVIDQNDPLSIVEDSLRAKRNENGFVYSEYYNRIGWIQDGHEVIIRFPESISDYDTMVSHCKLRKVTIDSDAVTE